MAEREPTSERNIDGYGTPSIPWATVRERLDQGLTQAPGTGGPDRYTCWLATVNDDGTPHVMPLGVLWIDGIFTFTSGPGTRKAKNLAARSACTLTVATEKFDLVVDGTATKVTDPARL